MNNNHTKKDYIFLVAITALLLAMLPKVCAQDAGVSAEKAQGMRDKLIEYSREYIGCPYRDGATGPATFDCSGFVFSMFRESIGIQLPRKSENIYAKSEKIGDGERIAGDLVFFKTTGSGKISHVGIFLGNDEFLHCASDGPETGVIISTLSRGYWKEHYAASGRYIKSKDAPESVKKNDEAESSKENNGKPDGLNDSEKAENKSVGIEGEAQNAETEKGFSEKLVFDATIEAGWNFFDCESFRLNFRGVDALLHVSYDGTIKPGIGAFIRYDNGTGNFQLPLVLSLALGDYTRIFAGPVIPLGKPNIPGDRNEEIRHSIFPGIIGICWNTPQIKAGKCGISLTQDIHYTVFNKTDGTALSPFRSAASGLVFSTGIRVTLPMSNLI